MLKRSRIKKIALLLTLASIILLAACISQTVSKGGVVLRGQPPKIDNYLFCYNHETIVYVTKNGKRYHTADCPYLTDSAIPISLEQAIAEGMTPCSYCYPDDDPES